LLTLTQLADVPAAFKGLISFKAARCQLQDLMREQLGAREDS
jgi:hypothetical protein